MSVWILRPLAYGLVAMLFRTPVTPNQVTLLAMLVGIAAGVCWFIGGPALMLVGGVLLWSYALLDGVDGALARAKQMQSELGRALDGTADMLVAIVTVAAAFYQIWIRVPVPHYLGLMVVALITAVMQIYLYDHYKEAYLQSSNPSWDGKTESLHNVEAKLRELRAKGASFVTLFAMRSFVGMLTAQAKLVTLTNPRGERHDLRFTVNDETARIHRQHNYGPMQLWMANSLCPHTLLMATCAIFDRIDLYLWYRLFAGNAIFIAAIIWQRIATARTLWALEAIDAAPQPEEPRSCAG